VGLGLGDLAGVFVGQEVLRLSMIILCGFWCRWSSRGGCGPRSPEIGYDHFCGFKCGWSSRGGCGQETLRLAMIFFFVLGVRVVQF